MIFLPIGSVRGRNSLACKRITAQEFLNCHALFSFRLNLFYGNPAVSRFKMQISFVISNKWRIRYMFDIRYSYSEYLESFAADACPSGRIWAQSPNKISYRQTAFVPGDLAGLLKDFRSVLQGLIFRLRQ